MEKQEQRYCYSLCEIAATVNSSGTSEDVLHHIVETAAKALGAKGCSLMLLTPDRTLLLHTAAYGLSDWYLRKGPLSTDRSIPEVLEGKAVAILDATEDDRIEYRKEAKHEGIVSIVSVPIMLREKVVGQMRVYTGERCHFTDASIDFMGAVANLSAVALENARLYDTVRKSYEALRLDLAEWRAALGDTSG